MLYVLLPVFAAGVLIAGVFLLARRRTGVKVALYVAAAGLLLSFRYAIYLLSSCSWYEIEHNQYLSVCNIHEERELDHYVAINEDSPWFPVYKTTFLVREKWLYLGMLSNILKAAGLFLLGRTIKKAGRTEGGKTA